MEPEKREAPGYMTFREAAIMFSLMDDVAAAQAIKATVGYFLYGTEATLEGPAGKVFEVMKASIDRNNEKYERIVRHNREAIKKRWKKEKAGK